jgi:magnesium transporter
MQIKIYLSQILGLNCYNEYDKYVGKIKDLLIDVSPFGKEHKRPKVVGVKMKIGREYKIMDFESFELKKFKDNVSVVCYEFHEINVCENCLWLRENVLDKQLIDINGRKLVRVNDVRMVTLDSGTYVLAVDVGMEGFVRRLGVERPIQFFLNTFKKDIPDRFILWDDIQTVDTENVNIKLSKENSKLSRLHP